VNSSHPLLRLAGYHLVLAALLMVGCRHAGHPVSERENALASIRETLEGAAAGSRSLFLPPECLPFLPANTTVSHPSAAECKEALSTPSSFHALHRSQRFERVFLTPGPLCASLRDHLLESPAWVLVRVLPEGYLFAPAGTPPGIPLMPTKPPASVPIRPSAPFG